MGFVGFLLVLEKFLPAFIQFGALRKGGSRWGRDGKEVMGWSWVGQGLEVGIG